jgi:hypothetical protein
LVEAHLIQRIMISRCLPSHLYPTVSVGLPVYNGAKFLARALDSLVSQDYPNFEIHISDNASEDGTWDIVKSYHKKCDRIRLHRWETNVGAVRNFQHVLLDCDAQYFMWAAHDGVWSGRFISDAVSVLQSDPSAVMVNAPTVPIDENDREVPLPQSRPQLCDLKDSSFPQRIEALAQRVGWCLYALYPRDAILKTSVLGEHEIAQDVIVTYELAGLGTLRVMKDGEFRYRITPKTAGIVADSLGVDQSKAHNPTSRMFKGCVNAIWKSPVAIEERSEAHSKFLNACAIHDEWWPSLSSEQGWTRSADLIGRLASLEELSRYS